MIRTRARRDVLVCLLVAFSSAACASKASSRGDETHFLCKVDDDCKALGSEVRCESGVCKAPAPPATHVFGLSQFCAASEATNGDLDEPTVRALLGDAASACVLRASDYDRSCATDMDCIAVGEGNACMTPCDVTCPNTAISAAAMSQYEADHAGTPIEMCPNDILCGCPCSSAPRCVRGTCEYVGCGAPPPDAGP
jgi:hypothetical protein